MSKDKQVPLELREQWREEAMEIWMNPPEGYQFPPGFGNPRDTFLHQYAQEREQEFWASDEQDD